MKATASGVGVTGVASDTASRVLGPGGRLSTQVKQHLPQACSLEAQAFATYSQLGASPPLGDGPAFHFTAVCQGKVLTLGALPKHNGDLNPVHAAFTSSYSKLNYFTDTSSYLLSRKSSQVGG